MEGYWRWKRSQGEDMVLSFAREPNQEASHSLIDYEQNFKVGTQIPT